MTKGIRLVTAVGIAVVAATITAAFLPAGSVVLVAVILGAITWVLTGHLR